MARNSKELAKAPAVDPEDEPSAEWGWHGEFPKGRVVAGVISIFILLVFMIGNYQSRTQDLWLIGFAVVIAIGIIIQVVRKRNSWRH
ncbi:DUF2631 domain-containing protein [Pseudonocardia sp. GCM10023141]|uniref:DUF2631 domain-containing protein n=1 Tax=Pseudonocardia sp. GCM10023141 TaxID=3252653 RepID=UPI00360E005E